MSITIKSENNGQFALVKDLYEWKDNPKDAEGADFKRLLKQIELGEHSSILVTPSGEVLGGNTRLKAYKSSGKEWAKVIIVDIKKEKNEYVAYVDGVKAKRTFDSEGQAKLEYALSHNDMVGKYNEVKLANLLHVHAIPTELYKVNMVVKPVEDVAFEAGPAADPNQRPEDESDVETDRVDTFMHGAIKQIVLYFDNAKYEEVMERIEALRENHGIENNTELFLVMLDHFEKVKPPKAE